MDYLSTQIMSHINSCYWHIDRMPACEDRVQLIDKFIECADKLKKVRDEKIRTNTELNYTYRDASNYKTYNSVVLEGIMTTEMFEEMKSCCEDGIDLFIPEQLGLDLIRDWRTTEDDHPYAELTDFELVPNKPTTDITVDELLRRFRLAKDNWHPEDYEPEIEEEDED